MHKHSHFVVGVGCEPTPRCFSESEAHLYAGHSDVLNRITRELATDTVEIANLDSQVRVLT